MMLASHNMNQEVNSKDRVTHDSLSVSLVFATDNRHNTRTLLAHSLLSFCLFLDQEQELSHVATHLVFLLLLFFLLG